MPDLRNPEFEAEIEKNKHRDNYVNLGKEGAEDFTKTFALSQAQKSWLKSQELISIDFECLTRRRHAGADALV